MPIVLSGRGAETVDAEQTSSRRSNVPSPIEAQGSLAALGYYDNSSYFDPSITAAEPGENVFCFVLSSL